MLDSPPTWHKHDFLMDCKHVVCNTGGPGFDSILQHFFSYTVQPISKFMLVSTDSRVNSSFSRAIY